MFISWKRLTVWCSISPYRLVRAVLSDWGNVVFFDCEFLSGKKGVDAVDVAERTGRRRQDLLENVRLGTGQFEGIAVVDQPCLEWFDSRQLCSAIFPRKNRVASHALSALTAQLFPDYSTRSHAGICLNDMHSADMDVRCLYLVVSEIRKELVANSHRIVW